MARSDERREKVAKKKAQTAAKVWIEIPEEFLDVVDEPWQFNNRGTVEELDFVEVLQHTIRFTPVKNGGDAERTLDILTTLREDHNGHIEMRQSDYDWMLAHFKELAFNLWKAPDSAYLVRYLEAVTRKTEPKEAVEA